MTDRPECTHPGPCKTELTIFDEEVCILPDHDTEQAIKVVAQHVANYLVSTSPDRTWRLYPHIGHGDWMRVTAAAEKMITAPEPEVFGQAYDHLVRRATAIT